MKTSQFQKTTKKLLPYTFLFGLLLLFTYGIPLTGNDLVYASASGLAPRLENSGGNFLSALLSSFLIDFPVLRHVLIAVAIGGSVVTLISFSGIERPYMYYLVLFLSLCAPVAIFTYCFGATLDAGSVLVPGFLVTMYIFTVSDLFVYKGQKKGWKIPLLFLNGFASQLFSEGIAIGILLISFLFMMIISCKYKFSWHLVSHLFGCVLGFTLSLLISGSTDSFSSSFYVMVDHLSGGLNQLFIHNLPLMILTTLACLLLIQPIRSERSKNCNITLYLLLIPMGFFVVFNVIDTVLYPFAVVNRFLAVGKLLIALLYTLGILRTLQHYVSKNKVSVRIKVSIATAWIFLLVYGGVGNATPAFLYIPYLLLVGSAMTLVVYALSRYSRFEKVIRKPLMIACILGVIALSFVTKCNNYYCKVVDTHINESLSQGTTEIELPRSPFENRLGQTNYSQLSDYYHFPSYGTVEISYVSYDQWDWTTYFEVHSAPKVEEEYEDEIDFHEWDDKFEED